VTSNLSDKYVELIAEAYYKGKCRFFIGAGVPKADLDLPLFNEIALILLKALIKKNPELDWCENLLISGSKPGEVHLVDGISPEQIAEFCSIVNEALLKKIIYESLFVSAPKGPCYTGLEALANYTPNPLEIVYTTNFDITIERYLGPRGVSISSLQEWKMKEGAPGVKVVHLNGIIEEGNYKISESDLYRIRLLTDPLYEEIIHNLYQNTLVFVGYALHDPSINIIFSIAKKIFNTGSNHYAIYPSKHLDNDEKKAQAKWQLLYTLWKDRGVILIDEEPGYFFETLIPKIHTMEVRSEIKNILIRRPDLSEDDIALMIERISNNIPLTQENASIAYLKNLL
jgi:hypothetical protein